MNKATSTEPIATRPYGIGVVCGLSALYTALYLAANEELRRAAGVSGQSTQRVYVDSRRTLYSRTGDWFAWILVAFTLIGLTAQGTATIRCLVQSQSE